MRISVNIGVCLALVTLQYLINAETHNGLENEAIILNSPVVLQCKSNSSVTWRFHDAKKDGREEICPNERCKSSRMYVDKDLDAGQYNLVINQSRADDAGKYYCIATEKQFMAELVILESHPVCTFKIENNFTDGVMVTMHPNDTVHICCEIRFWGNRSPAMEWKLEPGGRVLNASLHEELVQQDRSKTLKSILNMTIISTPVQTSPFQISFGGGNKPNEQFRSPNIPRYKYVWTSPNVSIQSHESYPTHSIHEKNSISGNTSNSIHINSYMILIGFTVVFVILLVIGVIVGLIAWKIKAISRFEKETRDRKTKTPSNLKSENSIGKYEYCDILDRDLRVVERTGIPESRMKSSESDEGYAEVLGENRKRGEDEILYETDLQTPGKDFKKEAVVPKDSKQSVFPTLLRQDRNYIGLDALTKETIGPPSIYKRLKNVRSRPAPLTANPLQISESSIDLDKMECCKPKLPTPESSSNGSSDGIQID